GYLARVLGDHGDGAALGRLRLDRRGGRQRLPGRLPRRPDRRQHGPARARHAFAPRVGDAHARLRRGRRDGHIRLHHARRQPALARHPRPPRPGAGGRGGARARGATPGGGRLPDARPARRLDTRGDRLPRLDARDGGRAGGARRARRRRARSARRPRRHDGRARRRRHAGAAVDDEAVAGDAAAPGRRERLRRRGARGGALCRRRGGAMTIRVKLYTAIVVSVAGLALTAGVGIWSLTRVADRFDAVQKAADSRALALQLKFDVTDFNGWQTAYGYDDGKSRPVYLAA